MELCATNLNCRRAKKQSCKVSLLNEIGLTLTAVAQTLAEQAEILKTYKLPLEGIQGLLVELAHSFDVIAEVQANSYDAVVTKFMHIEKRLNKLATNELLDYAHRANAHDFQALNALLASRLAQIELRISHIGAQLTVFAQEKPRKAGKRPAHKAKVTHKTR